MDSLCSTHYYQPFCSIFSVYLHREQEVGPLMSSAAESPTMCCHFQQQQHFLHPLCCSQQSQPVHLWPEVTVKAERAELQRHSSAAVQSTQCPPSWARSGSLGRHHGPAVRGPGSKSERTGSQALAVTAVLLFWAHQLILLLCNPCPVRSQVLCITVSHYWHSLNLMEFHGRYPTWTPAESHLCHCAAAGLSTKQILTSPGVTSKQGCCRKKWQCLRRNASQGVWK